MADNKTNQTNKDTQTDNTARAGVTPAQEKVAKTEAKEVKDEPAVLPTNDAIVEKLPDNGVVLGRVAVADVTEPTPAGPGGAYADEFAGQGGTYVVDGETGERKRAHEQVTDDKGKAIGFRPIP